MNRERSEGRRVNHPEQHRPRRARGGVVPPAETPAPKERKKRGPKTRAAIIAISVLLVLVVGAAGVAYYYLNRVQQTFEENRNVIEELDDLDDETAYRTSEGTINVLLLGSDSRGSSEEDYRSQLDEEGERSDAMMLVHIPEDRSGIYVMSIMRDLWVDVPGHGPNRVNSALHEGGLELAVDTVEELLYTHIDHVVTIDFEGFADLTEALGGVYVDNPRSFMAGQHNPAFYPEGTIRLEGSNALRFVRERQSFLMGDYVRVENQQLVLRGIVERFLSGDTLTNPNRIIAVLEAILPYMEMDEGLDEDRIISYALDMTNFRSNDVHMFTMPTGEATVTAGGAQVIMPDDAMMEVLREHLHDEQMGDFMEYLERVENGEEPPPQPTPEDEALQDGTLPEDGTDPGMPQDPESGHQTGGQLGGEIGRRLTEEY